eukprot:904003-Pleurochrysis_carterae.AAC.1
MPSWFDCSFLLISSSSLPHKLSFYLLAFEIWTCGLTRACARARALSCSPALTLTLSRLASSCRSRAASFAVLLIASTRAC